MTPTKPKTNRVKTAPLVLSTTHFARAVAWTKPDNCGTRGWDVAWPDENVAGGMRMQVFKRSEAEMISSWASHDKTVEIIIPRQFQ